MREPLALLSGLAFAAAGGALAVLWPTWLGFTVALFFGAAGFWLVLSRDASFEQEIDELLHEHAEIAVSAAIDADGCVRTQAPDSVLSLRVVSGGQA